MLNAIVCWSSVKKDGQLTSLMNYVFWGSFDSHVLLRTQRFLNVVCETCMRLLPLAESHSAFGTSHLT